LTDRLAAASVMPPMRSTLRQSPGIALLLLCGSLSAAGCGGAPEPVARLTVQPTTLKLGFPETRTIRFSWEPLAALAPEAGTPVVFVHLLDGEGEVVRTFDHTFPEPWQPGKPVSYEVELYQSALAPSLPPGRYRLTIGLYGAQSGERWPLEVVGGGEPLPRSEYSLVDVEIAGAGAAPRFVFSPVWLPVEPGGDRQLLALRWLGADVGVIRAEGVRSAGTVLLALRIPAGDGPGESLQLAGPAASGSSVLVSATCGGMESELSGPGPHRVEIPVSEPPAGGVCEIRLQPNFRLRIQGVAKERSVLLENVSWAPAR
jgi:hypothetical protein